MRKPNKVVKIGRWSPAPDAMFKIYVDGAVSRSGNQGWFIAACALHFYGLYDPATLEAMAYAMGVFSGSRC